MDVVADASVFLAVVLNETSRSRVIEKTTGFGLVAPEVLFYEIGNALVAVRRRRRLADDEVCRAFEAAGGIPVKLVPVAIPAAMKLALQFGVYAYDAYYLRCCIENRLPLVSLDQRMCDVARQLKIPVLE